MNTTSKTKPKGLLYICQNGSVYSVSPKTGRLYLTKFIKDDICSNIDYLYGRWQGRFGYIRLKGVKKFIYKPNLWINHVFRDDSLYVSFHEESMKKQSTPWGLWYSEYGGLWYSGYDFCLSGLDMVKFLYYCDYDEEGKKILMNKFEDKIDYYNEKFKDDLTYTYIDKSILPWIGKDI